MRAVLGYSLIGLGLALMVSASGCALSYIGKIEAGVSWLVLLFGGLPTIFGFLLFLTGRRLLATHEEVKSRIHADHPADIMVDVVPPRKPLSKDLRAHLRLRANLDRVIIVIGIVVMVSTFLPILFNAFGRSVGLGVYLWFAWIPLIVGATIIIGGWWAPSIKSSRKRTVFGIGLCGINLMVFLYLQFFTNLGLDALSRTNRSFELVMVLLPSLVPTAFFLIGTKLILAQTAARLVEDNATH